MKYILFFILMGGFYACDPIESFERKSYMINQSMFSLRHYPEWIELKAEDLPWGKAFQNMDSTRQGYITSMFRDTLGLSMRKSNIRIEYFSRNLPNCSNNDSVSMYIEKIMQQKYSGLTTSRDTAAFITRDGKKAAFVEAISPLNSIWFAWAYIPSDRFYIAFNLSTFSENEYSLMKDKFRALVESYSEEE